MCNKGRQQGHVMVTMLLVVFIGGSTLLLGAYNNRRLTTELRQHDEVMHQLELAKAALLRYAATSHLLFNGDVGPGLLPCPDVNNNGQPGRLQDAGVVNPFCLSGNTLGRLPQFAMLPDGSRFEFGSYMADPEDQQFWLVVAQEHLRTGPNLDAGFRLDSTRPRLRLDGRNGYVALLIAPGQALGNQTRVGTGLTNYWNYLDRPDDVVSRMFTSHPELNSDPNPDPDPEPNFNDRFVGITHDELMRFVGAAVTTRIWTDLAPIHGANGTYPELQPFFGTNNVQTPFVTATKYDWVLDENWYVSSPQTNFFFVLFYGAGYHSLTNGMIYTPEGNNAFNLRFPGCNQMVFRMTADGTFTRPVNTCQ